MLEAIILCGGQAWRLKPDTWVPKPLLKLGDKTLIQFQVDWLRKHGFQNIILATNQKFDLEDVTLSLEKEKLGTGGAVRNALPYVKGEQVYVMNVDDLVSYDPRRLIEYANLGASILLAKARLGFGLVELKGDMVIGFDEKPKVDFYVSAVHYVFKKRVIEEYFPEVGDLEKSVLPVIAKEGKLRGLKLDGKWYTINTYKDYQKFLEVLRNGEFVI